MSNMNQCQAQLTEIARKAKLTFDKNENLKAGTKLKSGVKVGDLEYVNYECASICTKFWIRFTMVTNTRLSGGESHNHDDLTQVYGALVEVRQALFDLYECISTYSSPKKMLALRVANVSWLKGEILDPLVALKDQMALKVNQAKNRSAAHGTVEDRRKKMQSGELPLSPPVALESSLLVLEERFTSMDYTPFGKELKQKLFTLVPELKDVRGNLVTWKLGDVDPNLSVLMFMELVGHATQQLWDSDWELANVKMVLQKLTPAWATSRTLTWSILRQYFSLDLTDTIIPLTPHKITLAKYGTEKVLAEGMHMRRQGSEEKGRLSFNDKPRDLHNNNEATGPPDIAPQLFGEQSYVVVSPSSSAAPAAAASATATATAAATPGLAPGEKKYQVGSHGGATFWYNTITKESTWIKPDDFEE